MVGLEIVERNGEYVLFRMHGLDGDAKVVAGKVVSAELLEGGVRLESERSVREEIQRVLDAELPLPHPR